jgi:hypothetical protein
MALSGGLSSPAGTDITVDCSNGAGVGGQIDNLDIQAVRVETLTADPVS